MSTGEIVTVLVVAVATFAILCGAWIGGHRAADRAADRAAGQRARDERSHAARLYAERMRGQGLPDPSGTVRTGPAVDPDATREIRIPPYMRMPDSEHKRRHRRYSP